MSSLQILRRNSSSVLFIAVTIGFCNAVFAGSAFADTNSLEHDVLQNGRIFDCVKGTPKLTARSRNDLDEVAKAMAQTNGVYLIEGLTASSAPSADEQTLADESAKEAKALLAAEKIEERRLWTARSEKRLSATATPQMSDQCVLIRVLPRLPEPET